jgi:putative selenate reductase
MKVQSLGGLLKWILKEYEENQSIFGIHRSLFYRPEKDSPYAIKDMFGQYLATPIGPAAGPHTQLTQNIIAGWLSGGRFMELKTVQIMDNLEIARPCIDMRDEGYNVEWSQELQLEKSVNEYIKAWVLIHILHNLLGFEGPVGTIFNMSVGYNLEGIQSGRMQRFMDTMADASDEIAEMKEVLRKEFPQFADIEIPARIINSVTLSTMHGCPPDEIGKIARYLLEGRKLHTTVKLNPTLLGKEGVLGILHDHLGYQAINIPDAVFAHDLQYPQAVELIRGLKQVAAREKLAFGVKLSNTLAMANNKGLMPGAEMYMSGRALYPVTMNLFNKFVNEFNGDLTVSYSAGADAVNLPAILSCGARPVTVASDLLKPGGYSNFLQYLENLAQVMKEKGAADLEELASNRKANLAEAAKEALRNLRYKKDYHACDLPKVESSLTMFDCIAAPCKEQCPVCQDVPEYAWLIGKGEYDKALEVILSRNPLPSVTGYVCTHLCQERCTRNNYDEPVAIRALKRFAAEHGKVSLRAAVKTGRKVAVIGAGPSGLAAASFLGFNGVGVTVFEAKDRVGGMMGIAPAFRVPGHVVAEDVKRITDMGVEIKLSQPIAEAPEKLLKEGYDAVYVATGFPKDTRLSIPGLEGQGVFSALELLERVAGGEQVDLGKKTVIIGGGNTAMDAARTAQRLTGQPVTVVYRRTKQEMPAIEEERELLFAEGNLLEELATPHNVILKDGKVIGLECLRNRLGEPDASGRRRPMVIDNSEFVIKADSVIVAIGQDAETGFMTGGAMAFDKNGAIKVDAQTGLTGEDCVYAGGDAVRGPAIVIQACADGRRAAEAICRQFGIDFKQVTAASAELTEADILKVKRARARKVTQQKEGMLPVAARGGFKLVEQTLTAEQAGAEAARCLQCSAFCDKCVEVCPNRANYTYMISPMSIKLPQVVCADGEAFIKGEEIFRVEQKRQILHLDDFCNECGNCESFCVHRGKPYLDKPRLFLKEEDYLQENDNAFFLEGNTLRRREEGRESKLSLEDGGITFENEQIRTRLSAEFNVQELQLKAAFSGVMSLQCAAEMLVVLKGVKDSLSFMFNV